MGEFLCGLCLYPIQLSALASIYPRIPAQFSVSSRIWSWCSYHWLFISTNSEDCPNSRFPVIINIFLLSQLNWFPLLAVKSTHIVQYYIYFSGVCFFSLSLSFFFNDIQDLFIYFIYLFLAVLGLHCCTQAFSSCGERGSHCTSLQCAGFSLQWLLLLWSAGSRHAGFSSCGTWAQ